MASVRHISALVKRFRVREKTYTLPSSRSRWTGVAHGYARGGYGIGDTASNDPSHQREARRPAAARSPTARCATLPLVASRAQIREHHRRRREESEREILEAAERLLRERPFRELTVDDLMAAAGQSRTAFYRHFGDRQELLIRLLSDLAEKLYEMAGAWLDGGDDPRAESLQSFELLIGVYERHGPLLRAIAEAANHDQQVELAYAQLVQLFIDATVARLERDQASGRISLPHLRDMAVALVWMSERYLTLSFGQPGAGDRAIAVAVLHTIWMRSIYRIDPPTLPTR
jgi:TetR/AcrR family transcriptional regulator, ethionamide resistance regulator